ncbi:MAG: glycosyltransferase family 2 protein [Bacteroidales bacterium]|nr:glycosyltransferase family 2 protein [Bacteroidales bacterium]
MKKITVAVSTYNRERFLPGLFESIAGQTMDKSLFETVIVDNNCTDNTAEIVHAFMEAHPEMEIRYVLETRQGLSFGRNRGIAESKGEYVTFADDDALLAPDFLEKVCDYLDLHPDVSEVGGPIFLQYLCPVPKWENRYMNSLLGYFNPSAEKFVMTGKNRTYPRGSNMTFRISVFGKAGMFNTELGRTGKGLGGGEEKDMAFRILDCGFRIAYIPQAVVYHLVPEERTTMEFIRRQARGVGASERTRSKAAGVFGRRVVAELIKWGVTFVLWLGYMACLKPAKAVALVKFRWWVSSGLAGK